MLTQVVLSHSGRMLFTGTSSGSVRVMKFPLSDQGEFQECQAHCTAVSRVRVHSGYRVYIINEGSASEYYTVDREIFFVNKFSSVPYDDEN